MEQLVCKVLVIGGGPGGYVAAIRAGQLGLDTILVDAEPAGGTCLNVGCIPSKALIHAASEYEKLHKLAEKPVRGISLSSPPALDIDALVTWKDAVINRLSGGVDGLLKKAGVRRVTGWAVADDAKTFRVEGENGGAKIQAEHVILANGSVATSIPGFEFGGNIWSSSEALSPRELPDHLIIIGAGYIGMELGCAYRKLGSEVTFIEAGSQILPSFDKELVRPVVRWLKSAGVDVHLEAFAKSHKKTKSGVSVNFAQKDGKQKTITGSHILITTGRAPRTKGWGIDNMCLDMDGLFIKIDDQCRTATKNVWAIGDITGEPMLAHRASAQGEMVAEVIAGHRRRFDPAAIASVCFTEPEIASAGISPAEAKQQGIETVVGKFPFAALGKAQASLAASDGGFVRVTARADTHLVIGLHAVGAHAGSLINQFALALEMGTRLEDIAGTIHVHPTMGEAAMEAAMAALGHAIHS